MRISKRQREAAKAYVDQQLNTMKKYGSAPMLSAKKYKALIDEAAAIGARARASIQASIQERKKG